MSATRLLLRRARAQAGLLGLVLLLVTVVSATVTGMVASTLGAAQDTARDALRDPVGASLQISTRLADDAAAQTAAADRALADELGGTSTVTDRTLRSLSLPVQAGGDAATDARIVLGSDPGLREHAHLVDGAWPAAGDADGTTQDPDRTVLHATAARALGVDVGDRLVVTGDGGTARTLQVVGTWLPDDPDALRWAGEGLVHDGVDGATGAFGPAVVDEHVLAAVPGIDMVRWTVVPDLAHVRPVALAGLADRLDALVTDVERDVGSGGVATTGELPTTLRGTATALAAVAAVTSSALALVALASVVALAQVARLLAAVRATETTVLRSRGTSVRQLTVAASLEAAVVSLPAVLLGAVLATVAVPAVRDAAALAPVVLGAVAVVLVGTATLTLGAHAAAVRAGERTDPAGRSIGTVATGALVLTLLVAALAAWRLLRTVTGTADPGADVAPSSGADPAAVAAVPLGVLAIALLAAAALRPVTALVARVVAVRGDLVLPLAARQLARRAALYAVPVVLVTLATATAGVAAVYTGTSQEQAATAAATTVGADVRAALADVTALQADEAPPTDALLAPGLGAGASAAAPVLRSSADAASAAGTALAVRASAVADVVRDDGVPGLARAASTLPGRPGWSLPDGTTEVRFTVGLDTSTSGGSAWWADADGRLRATSAAGDGQAWTATMPDGAVSLAAVEVEPGEAPTTITVTSVTAVGPDGATDLLGDGRWRAAQPGTEPVVETSDGPTVVLPPSTGLHPVVRVLPGSGTPLPVVLSQEWAAQDGLGVGSAVELRLAGHPVDAVVTAVVPVVPGAPGRAALVDLASAGGALLATAVAVPAPAEAWFAATAPSTVAEAVTAAADAAGLRARTVTAEPVPARASAAATAALVTAAACLLAMALPGVAAAALALSRARHPEVGVLHALGVRPRSQAGGRSAETGVVLGTAVLAGALGGLALGALLAPALVRVVARGPQDLAVPAAVSPQVAAALLGAAVLGCLLVVLADGRLVLRQAATGTVREDAR